MTSIVPVRMEVRPVFVAERVVLKEEYESDTGCSDYVEVTQRRTFMTELAAWRWVAWGYVFRARCAAGTEVECSRGAIEEHDCHLCHINVETRVHRLAERLRRRARRSSAP